MEEVLQQYETLEARILSALHPGLDEVEFNVLALEIHAFQRRWNEPYANFCATRPAANCWREIPAVPQSAFKRYRLTCVPLEKVAVTFLTSGTTGESRGAHHFHNTRLYDAAALEGWRQLGLPRLRRVILAPHPSGAPHSSLGHMLAMLNGEAEQPGVWYVGADGKLDIAKVTAELDNEGVGLALMGTALAFLNLFEALPTAYRLSRSFVMETGGYKGSGRDIPKSELYAMFERHLGIPASEIINEYGMTELSSQFYTRGIGAPHRGGPWVRALVIDPETGREVPEGGQGILRIFDLANLNSALAIETQDLAIRTADGFKLLGRDPGALPRGCSRAADELLRQ